MPNDFLEVTLGEAELTADGLTVGYADSVGLDIVIDYKSFDFSVPKRRIGKAKTKMTVNINASLKEIRPQNLVMAMGINESALSDILGNEILTFWKSLTTWINAMVYGLGVYVEPTVLNGKVYECTIAGTSAGVEPVWPTTVGNTIVDGTVTWTCRDYNGESVTLSAIDGGSLHLSQLANPMVQGTIVIYNQVYSIKYTPTVDYIVDSEKGKIYRNPSGAITAGQNLKVLYKYKELNYQQLNFNPDALITKEIDLKFDHRKPTDGKHIVFEIFRARAAETSLPFNPTDWSAIDLKLNGFNDELRENYPYGRLTWFN